MALYFINTRDDDDLLPDEVGHEAPDLAAVGALATMSLCELARDVLPGSKDRRLAVDVRDAAGQTVFAAELTFTLRPLSELS